MKKYFEALHILLDNAHLLSKFKKKNISKSINDVSFNDIKSKKNVPEFNNSAMDGYTIISSDTKNIKNEKIFSVIGVIPAGKFIECEKIKKNSIFKIMTGARIPKIFDAVVKKEDVILLNKNKIIIKKEIKNGENVRIFGSDYKIGEILLEKGEIIKPNHILIISSIGTKQIKILKKPKIYLLCTGNEIIEKKKDEIKNNCFVYNSSGQYIINFIKNLNFEINYLGLVKDEEKLFIKKIKEIIFNDDFSIIVTTGAVSVGSFDFISRALNLIKVRILIHGVKIKPGKPILFGKYKKSKYFFCLPGNPVSSVIGIRFFVYPFLRQILGLPIEKPFKAKLDKEYNFTIKYDLFLKSYCYCKDSVFYVKILEEQDSFKTKPMSKSNSFIFLKKENKTKINDLIDVYFNNPLNF